jgi:hypothetical protein
MRVRALLSVVGFFAAASLARAQIQVTAQTERTDYLLYERVDVLVTIQNLGDSPLVLDNNEGHPWLSFLVSKRDRLPVRPERESDFAALDLKVGETKTLRVNITPLFSFREEGQYKVEAVIDLPGEGQMLSQAVPFEVMRGKTVWTQIRPVDSSERIYSLIRFSPDSDTTRLYLRIENPSENTVYANLALGNIASYSDPEVNFDPKGDLHVLQPIALSTYLYTRADPDGKILDQTVFKSVNVRDASGSLRIPPRLRKVEDGNVVVMGGQAENPNMPREKLSDAQRGTLSTDPNAPPEKLPDPQEAKRAEPVALPVSTP